MHNLTKIRLFRICLWITYPLAFLFVYPFVSFKRKRSGLIFFFDRYAIGGAQRIHLDILQSVADIEKEVYFTRKSPNDKLKHAFYSIDNSVNKDIHIWCDYLLFRLFSVHYYAFYLNSHKSAHVLSSNSTFFYDMLPFIGKHIHCTELLHNFSYGNNGMEFFGLANHKRLDTRIVYDSFTLSNIQKQYEEYKVASEYLDRILFIEPGVEIPAATNKDFSLPMKVLYAGRGGPQKRVWLLNRIIEQTKKDQLNVEFHFAGPIEDELSEIARSTGVVHGQIGKKEEMNALYSSCHILILTSAYEGFPMVIKESMAYGCVPVVTALEGNKMHLQHLGNALLINAIDDEDQVVQLGVENLSLLIHDVNLLQQLSARAYAYAQTHFNREAFLVKYRQFLLQRIK